MRLFTTVATYMFATAALADVPKVVTDIAPVQSLVAQVMQGVGEPDLIVPASSSPHDHAMRPSEAASLAQADVVIWMGPSLTPWLAPSIVSLAPDAVHFALQDHAAIALPFREGAHFEAHTHGDHEEGGHDDAEGHDAEGHDDDHADEHNDEHAEGHKDEHGHEGGIDPHMWLDTANAQAWVEEIVEVLSTQDPDNKELYIENGKKAAKNLADLEAQIGAQLAPFHNRPFVVFHDAFHYFEARFGVEAAGAISGLNAQAPSPSRLREIEHVIEEAGAACVFAEPQFNAGIVAAVAGDAHVGTIDPLGFGLALGPDMYTQLLTQVADAFEVCLATDAKK